MTSLLDPEQEKKMPTAKVTPCASCRELIDESEAALKSYDVVVCRACADDTE